MTPSTRKSFSAQFPAPPRSPTTRRQAAFYFRIGGLRNLVCVGLGIFDLSCDSCLYALIDSYQQDTSTEHTMADTAETPWYSENEDEGNRYNSVELHPFSRPVVDGEHGSESPTPSTTMSTSEIDAALRSIGLLAEGLGADFVFQRSTNRQKRRKKIREREEVLFFFFFFFFDWLRFFLLGLWDCGCLQFVESL